MIFFFEGKKRDDI